MDPFSADAASRPEPGSKAEFARFHDEYHPKLVAVLHALHGSRTHAQRAAAQAFTEAWLRWPSVRELPDPAAWTRQRALRIRPSRRRLFSAATAESEWIAPAAHAVFDALSALPDEQRSILALHKIGGVGLEQIAREQRLSLGTVAARLELAYQCLAARLGGMSPVHPSRQSPEALHQWATTVLADLTHALSYGTDRPTAAQVFHLALWRRVKITAVAAAVVSLGLGGGLVAVSPRTGSTRPPLSAPGSALPVPPRSQRPRTGPPTVPGAPPLPGAQPVGGTAPDRGESAAEPFAGVLGSIEQVGVASRETGIDVSLGRTEALGRTEVTGRTTGGIERSSVRTSATLHVGGKRGRGKSEAGATVQARLRVPALGSSHGNRGTRSRPTGGIGLTGGGSRHAGTKRHGGRLGGGSDHGHTRGEHSAKSILAGKHSGASHSRGNHSGGNHSRGGHSGGHSGKGHGH